MDIRTALRQQALPLTSTEADNTLDDLQPLSTMIGDETIIGLGEATHGSHEFFTMKHRLLEFLVRKKDFTVLTLEGSWSSGIVLDDYIMHGKGDLRTLLKQEFRIYWCWRTQEVEDLIAWMRSYNADARHQQKLRFAGSDPFFIGTVSYEVVTAYLKACNATLLAQVESCYQALRPTLAEPEYIAYYEKLPEEIRKQYLAQAQQAYDLLNERKEELIANSSEEEFAWSLQNARVIVQFATLFSYSSEGSDQARLRDTFMAENTKWLCEHWGKILFWAHNGHIGINTFTDTESQTESAGTLLRQQFGDGYLALGFSFYDGSLSAQPVHASLYGQPEVWTVGPPSQESSDSTLGDVGLDRYMLDLRHLSDESLIAWAREPRPFRVIGKEYSPEYEALFYLSWPLSECFDLLIHLQHVTASQVFSDDLVI